MNGRIMWADIKERVNDVKVSYPFKLTETLARGNHMEKRTFLLDWPIWGVLALDLAVSLYAFPYLPDKVPIHWNLSGQPDAWGSAFIGSFSLFFIAVSIYLLMTFLPIIDPRRANYESFAKTYWFIKLTIVLFFVAVHFVTLASIMGWPVPMNQAMAILVSALFIMLGKMLGQIKQTFLVGIRTAWTLADEGVWIRTHQFSGRVWIVAGWVGVIGGIMGGTIGQGIFFAALAAVILLPVVYSYFDFRRHNH